MEMSKRERLTAALKGQPVDRLPWAPLIDDYFISSLPEQGYHYEIIEAMRYIGNDILERHVCAANEKAENVKIDYQEKDGMRYTTRETPVGKLTNEYKFTGKTWVATKYAIETVEDMKAYQYICEHTGYVPAYDVFTARDQYIGDDGMATMSGNMSPIQELLQHQMGVEGTVYALMDYPDEMEALMQAMHERNKRQYKVLAGCPGLAIFDYEDTSTTVMNKSMFTDYTLPFLNEYADIVHENGKLFIAHMCGKLTGFINEVPTGRMDGMDSICPPSTGDLFPWDARKAWDTRTIIGGIEPPALSRMTVRETLDITAEIIQKMPTLQGFILSTGDAVPYATPINNMIAVTKMIEALGEKSLDKHFDTGIIDTIVAQF